MNATKNCVRSPRCNGNDTVCSGVSKPIDPKHHNPKSKVTNLKVINDDVSAVTLKRTDTTLDLSQKAKRFGKRKYGMRDVRVILYKIVIRVIPLKS